MKVTQGTVFSLIAQLQQSWEEFGPVWVPYFPLSHHVSDENLPYTHPYLEEVTFINGYQGDSISWVGKKLVP